MKNQSIALMIITFLQVSCAHGYDKTVEYVDRDRFTGKWYVMAGRFTMFEKDVFNAVEKYTWNESKQRIDIDFSYNKGSFNGELKKMPQKGWIENTATNATWKISPLWPFKFTYLVIALDSNYEWTVIGVPNQNYVWIMARDPHLAKDKIQEILKYIASIHYSVEDIVYVEHSEN